MSMFNRSGGGTVRNYHSYITENQTLHNIGLASYSRNTMANFGMERKNGTKTLSKDIDEYFDNKFNTLKPKLLGDSVTLSILKFEKETKRYFLATSNEAGDRNIWYTPSGSAATSLQNFQERFDLWQKGFITDDAEKYKLNYVWSNIQTSLSGCITFDVDYTVLTCEAKSLVRLYFQSGGKASSERTVATAVGGMHVGVPSRPTNASYGYTGFTQTNPGVYPAPTNGGIDDADNTVAAPIRMSYDPATNKWESGTQQMLFRLLTDIDGVSIPDLPSDVDATDLSEFYDGPLSSKFVIGSGMPVSIENGNPHLFGPNSNGCGPSPKEKVVMVNRTPRSYSKNEIVIGSLINGEWIPMGFGPAKTVASKKFNIEWSNIQKYIVNAKSYFRNASDTRDITPETYINHVRFKFYDSIAGLPNASQLTSSGNDLNRIALLNLNNIPPDSYELGDDGKIIIKVQSKEAVPNYLINVNLTPSTGYLQFFDADVIKTNLCGNNDDSRLKRTNVKQTQPSYPDTGDLDPLQVTSSWGMYFTDGYTSSSVAKLKNAKIGRSVVHTIVPSLAVYNAESNINFSAEANVTLNLGDFVGQSFEVSDNNLYHFPAQIALNSSGNQTILSNAWWFVQNKPGNYAGNVITYLNDPYKGDFVVDEKGKNVFDLKPINPTSVQFTPLSLQLALCSTNVAPNTQEATLTDGLGGYADLNLSLKSQMWNYKAFGKAWTRLGIDKNLPIISNGNVTGGISFGKSLNTFGPGATVFFSKPERSEKPDGGPGLLPWVDGDEISNVNGILAAKATVSLPAGGQLELRTNNRFGLNAYGRVIGGVGETTFTFAGLFGLIPNPGGGEIKVYDFVQWGASSASDIRAFGTTALWCKITDHCPNTIYDARFFAPLQFNVSGSSVDIDVPAVNKVPIPIGTLIDTTFTGKIEPIKNPIRRNMLLSGGGFYYIKRIIAADPSRIEIVDEEDNVNFDDSQKIEVIFNGKVSAKFKVTEIDAEGAIVAIAPNTDDYGMDAYGEFSSNVFKDRPLEATVTNDRGGSVVIRLHGGKIIEKIERDTLEEYGTKILTPPDNDGGGDSNGYVLSSRSTTYSLSTNNTGKYDIFLFLVNDIMNYPENGNGANGTLNGPFAQYINLEISAN